jgi:hypothetical protein
VAAKLDSMQSCRLGKQRAGSLPAEQSATCDLLRLKCWLPVLPPLHLGKVGSVPNLSTLSKSSPPPHPPHTHHT